MFKAPWKWRHKVVWSHQDCAQLADFERPIYTAENIWYGSDKTGSRTKKDGSARVNFVVYTILPYPYRAKILPVLGPTRELVRARIKLVRVPENRAICCAEPNFYSWALRYLDHQFRLRSVRQCIQMLFWTRESCRTTPCRWMPFLRPATIDLCRPMSSIFALQNCKLAWTQ